MLIMLSMSSTTKFIAGKWGRAYFSTRKIALEIKSINENLNSIKQRATEFDLRRQLSGCPPVGSNLTLPERETASNPDPFVVGRENYVSSIVETLTHDQQDVFSVLPIVGMGGVGKTTLAKFVFHDKKIENHFEKRIWVFVSESFSETTILKKILGSFAESSNDDSKTKEALLTKIRENLKDKKYLVVLDDVWTEETEKLDDFVDTLRSIASIKGNGIIVTTRNRTAASIMGTTPIVELRGLPGRHCWSIIKEKAFGKGCVIPAEFKAIGKEIANKCQGLPLAAKVVGCVLRGKPLVKWRSIAQNQLSNLGEDGKTMRKILKLSFDNLSDQSLKKCFAFCGIFPKGYRIQKSMLIPLWMAEGFLQSDDMETLGSEYFDLLLCNSLLEVGERDYHGNIAYYTMHHLVWDLACSILKESGPVRCIYTKSIMDISKEEARNMRSLIFEGEISDDNMLSDFRYLRGLVLIGAGNKLPKIGHLIHLRYLDIFDTSIGCSPKLIGNLYLLQTFRAKVASNELPKALKKLINLRHVYVQGTEETSDETQLGREVVASSCLEHLELHRCQKPTSATSHFPNLKTFYINRMHSSPLLKYLLVSITSLMELQFEHLPGLVCLPDTFFHNNQNLMYLSIYDCRNLTHLPPGIEVSLREFDVDYCWELEGLPGIPHCLDKLELCSCPNIKSIPYNPSDDFPSVRELTITDCDGLTELPIGLLESCMSSLESVRLWRLASLTNMGNVIACLQKMSHLTSLKIDLKHLANDEFPIDIVGSFDRLRDLEITCGMKIWHRLQDLLQNLNALRKLKLYEIEIEAVPEWLGNLSSLRELELWYCPRLRSLPSKRALRNLTKLRVYDCPLLNLQRSDPNSEWHKVSHILNQFWSDEENACVIM